MTKPKIIAVLNPKGGCGKTTIAINLAHSFKNKGYKTILIDSDTQRSSMDWYNRTDGNIIPVEFADEETIITKVESIKTLYDIIIIDGASKVITLLADHIKMANFILIPIRASALDVWAVAELLGYIKAYNRVPITHFVISADRKITKASKEVVKDLEPLGIKILDSRTTLKVDYEMSINKGETIYMCSKQDISKEIDNIRNEIIEVLNGFESKK